LNHHGEGYVEKEKLGALSEAQLSRFVERKRNGVKIMNILTVSIESIISLPHKPKFK
jgi:hypothetical protein